ncbi:orotidine 5'-phosphate decarboxylase / HUMPS family protein [Atopobium minutum]|uniref:orotidine 5'-phosphate decarboxylase / HUMPS family protein n=1 Tax=Atopobium minutum TaxID=1381 RepID=UPI0025D4BC6D|nr:orotidine 5'-phosphate decarboxylase / HUMPS family protein [Atopobium minutum]
MPKLQAAFDLVDLDQALAIATTIVDAVDIIEAGTVLVIENGLDSVRKLRAMLPEAIILADIRIIKAGGKLAKMAYEAGADIVTIMSDATKDTFEAVLNEKQAVPNRDVFIEINDRYTEEELEYWLKIGFTNIIFHRASEVVAEHKEWCTRDFDEINRLNHLGFSVYVTGGIEPDDIAKFSGVSVGGFIVGRSITQNEDPSKAACNYAIQLSENFSCEPCVL